MQKSNLHYLSVSIIIPVFNNSETLQQLKNEVFQAFKAINANFEIIFVNDASTDDSWRLIAEMMRQEEQITGINLPLNLGQNAALIKGLGVSSNDYVIVMDADLQDSPAMIPDLITSFKTDIDAVFILRQGNYQSNTRMFTSLIFKSFLQLITGLNRKAGSYYMINSQVSKKVKNFKCRYPILTVMIYAFSKNVKYIPSFRKHNNGQSSYSFSRRVRYAFRATYCAIQCKISNL